MNKRFQRFEPTDARRQGHADPVGVDLEHTRLGECLVCCHQCELGESVETAMLPRDAFFGETEQVPAAEAVGRIAAEKGVEFLLEAARRLPDAHLVLAGPDDRHGTMATVRAALGEPDRPEPR